MLDKQKLVEYINKVIENYKPEKDISIGEFIYASIDHIIEEYASDSRHDGYNDGYADGSDIYDEA